MNWKEEYSVGIKEIDEQHKKIFSIISDLHQSVLSGTFKQSQKMAEELSVFAQEHQIYEEKLHEKYDYPQKEEHLEEHIRFSKMGAGFALAFKTNEKEIHVAYLKVLKKWILEHLIQYDLPYGPFLADKNITEISL